MESNECFYCKKRIRSWNYFSCKCSHIFCLRHRLPFIHMCEYNWKKQHQELIYKNIKFKQRKFNLDI